MYDDEHEKYAADSKPTMSAHLQNMMPAALTSV